MLLLPVDCAGCVENPHFLNVDELAYKGGWAALVHRQGASVKITAFLPKNKKGTKIDVGGLQKGLYIAFGATNGSQKLRSLYSVEAVSATVITFQYVEDRNVPTIYEIDVEGGCGLYLLKAKQTMLEAQINDIRKWLSKCK